MRLIDADALKEAIEDNDNFVGGSYDIIKVVDAQPTILPKRGKWIYTGIEQNSFYCDKCLYLVKNMSYKFCPNCGAKMEVTECSS